MTTVIENNDYEAPMIFPFLNEGNQELRKKLIDNKIYTATYWPPVKVWLKENNYRETYLKENLLPLPIDQSFIEKWRYL